MRMDVHMGFAYVGLRFVIEAIYMGLGRLSVRIKQRYNCKIMAGNGLIIRILQRASRVSVW
jgi:hypothetical protein